MTISKEDWEVWDLYAAAALSGAMNDYPGSYKEAALRAAKAADELLAQRHERIRTDEG
jgi:hypothetical protein